ncbi:MAG: pimeloyl-ACP methyl ester esterase BioH [Methylococcaceae bacterium]|nr:pimeloyl-ACP methyl ester esterase BioH [Methylococcaceae bacterium]
MTQLYTETFGEGKPIVMVHGWAMHSGIWRNFAKELSKTFRVTVVDLPGHGHSQPIYPFSLESVSRLLVEVIPDHHACWLGWSLGAEIVIEIASRFPERVSQLILLAGTPCFVGNDLWPGIQVKILDSFAESLSLDSQATLLRFLSLQIKGESNPKQALQELKKSIFEYPAPDQRTLLEGLEILKQSDLRQVFAEIKIPVAAILGELDTLVPVAAGENMQSLLPHMELATISRAGHAPFLSHQGELVEAICGFMETK